MSLYIGKKHINDVSISFINHDGSTNTNDATLSSGNQMLQDITAYSKNIKYTGTIPTKNNNDISVNGNVVKIPYGYYDQEYSKSVAETSVATPTISISEDGLITASTNQTSGYVNEQTKSTTKQLTTKGAATIVPSENIQTISSGQYLTGTQTIAAIPSDYIGSAVVVQNYYTGSTEPSNSLGNNGDLYLIVR